MRAAADLNGGAGCVICTGEKHSRVWKLFPQFSARPSQCLGQWTPESMRRSRRPHKNVPLLWKLSFLHLFGRICEVIKVTENIKG